MTTHEGLPELLSICRWGQRFYSEASGASRRQEQSQALLALELQRATLISELQAYAQPASWPDPTLIPLVREASHDEQILDLCDRIDAETISAYTVHLGTLAPGTLRTLLERHLGLLASGQERRAGLRRG